MKSILVADNRPDLLATLEPILKHWGYRVLSTRKADQAVTFLRQSSPCLLIIGEDVLCDLQQELDPATLQRIKSGDLPAIALKQEGASPSAVTPATTLEVPVGLFELFAFIQGKVEKHPRQNLRLRLKLPGMYSVGGDNFILAEVMSLSMRGLFFRAASRLKQGARVNVVFPLLGHCKEIEVESTVLYVVHPDTANNFAQGFGVAFDDISEAHKQHLQKFISEHFLNEVSAHRGGVGDFAVEQLKS